LGDALPCATFLDFGSLTPNRIYVELQFIAQGVEL